MEYLEKYFAYKTVLLNGTVLGLTLVDVQTTLQIILVFVTIGYTAWKWYSNWKKK
jgi:hypothetical protein